MDDPKKMIKIAVIIGCLVLAVVLAVSRLSRDSATGGSSKKTVWLKCRDPKCGATFEMSVADYGEALSKYPETLSLRPRPITCQQCNKNSAFQAEKCPKCGEIFELYAAKGAYPDECPKCHYSEREERRKKSK